jgi:hypothetical protein
MHVYALLAAIGDSRAAAWGSHVLQACLVFLEQLWVAAVSLDSVALSELCVLGFVLYSLVYLLYLVETPRVVCKPSSRNARIIAAMPKLKKWFWPTFWLPGSHCQTGYVLVKRDHTGVQYEREMLDVYPTADIFFPGKIGLDWAVTSCACTDTTPVVIIFHGLSGGSSEPYVKSSVDAMLRLNRYRAVVINARSCGNTPMDTPQGYSAAYTEDHRQVSVFFSCFFLVFCLSCSW